MGTRRLFALLKGLPPGGALHRELDPKAWAWSTTEELLAGLIEVVDTGNRLFYSANTRKGIRPLEPIRVPRPWREEKPEKPKQATSAEVIEFFSRKRRGA